jgi:hypothetical protein
MTETQLNLLREWFREEVEYLIRKEISPKKQSETYYDDYQDDAYYADKAFRDVVVAFCKEKK